MFERFGVLAFCTLGERVLVDVVVLVVAVLPVFFALFVVADFVFAFNFLVVAVGVLVFLVGEATFLFADVAVLCDCDVDEARTVLVGRVVLVVDLVCTISSSLGKCS